MALVKLTTAGTAAVTVAVAVALTDWLTTDVLVPVGPSSVKVLVPVPVPVEDEEPVYVYVPVCEDVLVPVFV